MTPQVAETDENLFLVGQPIVAAAALSGGLAPRTAYVF